MSHPPSQDGFPGDFLVDTDASGPGDLHRGGAVRRFPAEVVARHAELLANRVAKRQAHLKKRFAREGIEAYRLYDRDIPEVRAVVDWYAGHLVVAEYERLQTGPDWLPTVAAAAARALGVPADRLHLRRRHTGSPDGDRYRRLASGGERFPVRERDLRFLVDLDDFLDTGLFSDHRETRRRVRAEAAGRDFLNLFCYTGAFSCAAAAGGARGTTSVDRNTEYLAWLEENLALNGLARPGHTVVHADVVEYLDRLVEGTKRFGLAVVDPPSFSRNRGPTGGFEVERDHPRLLAQVMAVLVPGGVAYFSTNHQRFEPRFEGLDVAESIVEITPDSIPEDYRNRHVHRCWRIVRG